MANRLLPYIAACSTLFVSAPLLAGDLPAKELTTSSAQITALSQQFEGDVPVVVKYRDGTAQASSMSRSNQNGIELRNILKEDLEAELQKLRMNDAVEYAEPNYIVSNPKPVKAPVPTSDMTRSMSVTHDSDAPNDPVFDEQYTWRAPTETYLGQHNGLKAAHQAGANKKLSIGVIDSEFRVTDELQYAGGYNFSTNSSDIGPEYLEPFYFPDCRGSHGTAVANIIGAPTNNGIGMAGFVDANIWAARSMDCGSGYLLDTAKSIRWLAGDLDVAGAPPIGADIDIINTSLSAHTFSCPTYMQDAIDYAYNKGITVIVAAGNSSSDAGLYSPANCDHVITVGSVDRNGLPSYFTNHGDFVDVAALGEEVISMTAPGKTSFHYGTSFSSPNVAGMAALIKQTNPMLTPNEIANYLKSTAIGLPDNDSNVELGSGITQPAKMVSLVAERYADMQPTIAHVFDDPSRCNKEAYQALLPESVNACQLYEVDTSNLPTSTGFHTVFEADEGSRLTASNGTAVATSSTPIFLVADLQGSKQYGVGICEADGTNCTQDNLFPLGNEDIITDRFCE